MRSVLQMLQMTEWVTQQDRTIFASLALGVLRKNDVWVCRALRHIPRPGCDGHGVGQDDSAAACGIMKAGRGWWRHRAGPHCRVAASMRKDARALDR